MTDLVVVSLEAWDGVWRRNQHLLSRMLAADPDLRVLFVEPPADPLHQLRRGARPEGARPPRARHEIDRLWTMRPAKALPRRIDARADERLSRQIERAARRLGMTQPLLWVNDLTGATVSRRTGWPTLYDMTDDWLAADRPDAERERLRQAEEFLLAHAAQVVACSPELQRRKSASRPPGAAPIALIRNGVDVAAYRTPRPRPADLPAGKTAMYVGTLHADRLDVDLCVDIACGIAGEATLVLVGPNALAHDATGRLRDADVALLGARPADAVIGYLQHADVLVVPHVVDAFTDSLDPIKLYEYQAVDRPVVSTPVAGFRDADDPRITVADVATFKAAVASAFAAADAPVGKGKPPDWNTRASEMASAVQTL